MATCKICGGSLIQQDDGIHWECVECGKVYTAKQPANKSTSEPAQDNIAAKSQSTSKPQKNTSIPNHKPAFVMPEEDSEPAQPMQKQHIITPPPLFKPDAPPADNIQYKPFSLYSIACFVCGFVALVLPVDELGGFERFIIALLALVFNICGCRDIKSNKYRGEVFNIVGLVLGFLVMILCIIVVVAQGFSLKYLQNSLTDASSNNSSYQTTYNYPSSSTDWSTGTDIYSNYP